MVPLRVKADPCRRVASGPRVTTGLTGSAPTWMMKVRVALTWPARSVAVQVTTVVPNGKTEPLGGVHVTTGEGSRASKAKGERNATEAPRLVDASTTRACGTSTSTGPP